MAEGGAQVLPMAAPGGSGLQVLHHGHGGLVPLYQAETPGLLLALLQLLVAEEAVLLSSRSRNIGPYNIVWSYSSFPQNSAGINSFVR
jgi:hypothetical protein